MSINKLTEKYNKQIQTAEQNFMAGFAAFLDNSVTQLSFEGDEEYDDEDYHFKLSRMTVNGVDVSENLDLITLVHEKVFGVKPEYDMKRLRDDEEGVVCDIWYDFKEDLMNILPDFVKTKTTTWKKL